MYFEAGLQETETKEDDAKPRRLTLDLLIKRNLPSNAVQWDYRKIIEELNKATHIRLDRENIGEIDNFELLGLTVTNLYLQQNKIRRIENLECLPGLTFLMLANNKIKLIANLLHLPKLAFLDVSQNCIQDLDAEDLPQSLVILNLEGNPCTEASNYRQKVISELPHLRQLDTVEITVTEKREAGYVVSSDEETDDDDDDEKDNSHKELSSNGTLQAGVFEDLTSDILLRSQSRLEEVLREHKHRTAALDDIRCNSVMLPESSRSQLGSRSGSRLSGQHSGSRPPSSGSTISSYPGSRLGSRGSPLPPIGNKSPD